MATFNKFDAFIADVYNGVHDLSADTIKVMLTNTAPVAGNTVKANITEITAGNGYTAGGAAVGITSSSQTGGSYSLVPSGDPVITASGGTVGPFRYVVVYNDTPLNDNLIGWYDYGSSLTLNNGESFTIDFGANLITAS